MSNKYLWAEMTRLEIEEAQSRNCVVLMPLGSIEQHGPHLSVDVDAYLSSEMAKRAAQIVDDILVTPPIWSGYSPEHKGMPGVLYVRLETIQNLLLDLCHSIADQGFERIILLNGHGGNSAMMRAVAKEFLRTHGISIACADLSSFGSKELAAARVSGPGGVGHAGERETSLHLYLRPELVDMELAPTEYWHEKFGNLSPFVRGDVSDLSASLQGRVWIPSDFKTMFPSGLQGDATVATAETGKRLYDATLSELCDFLKEFRCFEAKQS